MRKLATIIFYALTLALSGCAERPRQGSEAVAPDAAAQGSAKLVRVSAENTDSAEPALAAAADGTAYVAWVEHRGKEADVWVARLDRDGGPASAPSRVNPVAGAATAWRGDAPTIAVAPEGAVYVGWTSRIEGVKHADDLHLSVSRDGGRTFGPPVKVNDDREAVGHGMHSLAVGPDGRVYVAWLDERNVARPAPESQDPAQKKMEHMEANREVFVAASSDGGRTFSPNVFVAKEACPCCKTSIAAGEGGRVFVGWRQVLPGEFRHIGVAASADGGRTFGSPVTVSDDRWMIAACPVSGPALSLAADGTLRAAWYTEGDRGGQGLYWAESRDDGRTFSAGRSLTAGRTRGNPLLLSDAKGTTTAVWESEEGGSHRVMTATLAGEPSPLASNAELPSAALAGGQLFVGYIAKINDRRSVWVVRKPVG